MSAGRSSTVSPGDADNTWETTDTEAVAGAGWGSDVDPVSLVPGSSSAASAALVSVSTQLPHSSASLHGCTLETAPAEVLGMARATSLGKGTCSCGVREIEADMGRVT